MDDEILLTEEGYRGLEEELETLKTEKRPEVSQRIKEARAFGDISENAEYEEAKNDQAFIEGRIATIENMLRHARVVNSDEVDPTEAHLGATVTVKNVDNGDEFEFTIVGATEADPAKNRISYESPVGAALYEQRAGDVVDVQVPAGTTKYRIVDVAQ